ncbi:MAG: hypothetical protein QOE13_3287, partial [Gaiellaceae bacterium]|nr:hypothetical protein [Gaiellaceae bacterium]
MPLIPSSEAVREAGAKYRGLLEAAPDAMIVVNQAGTILFVNLEAEEQLGYLRDELVGQPATAVVPSARTERLVVDATRTKADVLAQLDTPGLERVARRKDGSEYPVEITFGSLEIDGGILVIGALRDISVRKAAERHLAQREGSRSLVEEALRQSEESYRLLLDGIQDYAIFMMDPAGKILSWNAGAERIKGYRADEIIGQNFSRFFPPEDIEQGRPEEVL